MSTQITNPAFNPAKNEFGSETYTIKGMHKVFYYHRVRALEETRNVAVEKGIEIIILLNWVDFCKVYPNGTYEYIYDSSADTMISPQLKQLFKQKGIAVN